MKINAIIFDLDGTLIDSMALWRQVDSDFLNARGIAVPQDLFEHLPAGNSFIQTAQYFKDRFGLFETCEEIMQIWTDMVSEHYAERISLKAGVMDLLTDLAKEGIKLGLATSNSYQLAKASLTKNEVWHLFESFATGDQQLLGKPHPDIFLASARGLDLPPSECVAIEDTLPGVKAAKSAGMYTLAIYDADSTPEHDRIKELADAFCMDYLDIRNELRKLKVEI